MATYNGVRSNFSSGSANSLACSASISVAVGDLVHVGVKYEGGTTTCSIADGLGNTYTPKDKVNHSGGEPELAIFECFVTVAGTATPTASLGASRTFRAIAAHFFTPDGGSAFSADSPGFVTAQGTAANPSSGSYSPTGAGPASAFFALYQITTGTQGAGWTETYDIDTFYAEYQLLGGAGAITGNFTFVPSDRFVASAMNTLETASGFAVASVDGDNITNDGQAGVVVVGAGMGTTNADRTFTLRRDGVSTTLTEVGTGTSTLATLNISHGNVRYGSGAVVRCTLADTSYAERAITANPAIGHAYTDIGTPAAASTDRLGNLAAGDQVEYYGAGGQDTLAGAVVVADGKFSVPGYYSSSGFWYRIWDVSDATWGAAAFQAITVPGIVRARPRRRRYAA